MTSNVYEIVTEKIIASLEAGVVPWRKPWNAASILPRSLSSRKPYRGVNVLLLGISAAEKGYRSPWWGTYKQIEGLGGQIRKGEKSTLVVFWKILKKTDVNASGKEVEKKIPLLRYFRVFNAEQADGLPEKFGPQEAEALDFEPIEEAERIFERYFVSEDGPEIVTGGDGRAWYSPARDLVSLPPKESFHSAEEFYSTAFHEATHSTGHESRLNRSGVTEGHRFGDTSYAKEELVAEIGATLLCGLSGIEQVTLGNSASYLDNWIKALKGDVKLIVSASAAAQKAADLVAGVSFAKTEEEPAAPAPAPELVPA